MRVAFRNFLPKKNVPTASIPNSQSGVKKSTLNGLDGGLVVGVMEVDEVLEFDVVDDVVVGS